MRNAGVNKFSCVSSAGVGDTWNAVDSLSFKMFVKMSALNAIFAWHAKVVTVVNASGLDYQHCHPLMLTHKGLSGTKAQVVKRMGFNAISRADVAEFMLDQVELPGAFQVRQPLIIHPESL